jgi:hypothetical protein
MKLNEPDNYGRYPVQCQKCGMVLQNKFNLRRHDSIVHLRNFPFQCSVCRLGLGTKQQLENHMLIKHS